MSEAFSSKWDCDYIKIINVFMNAFTTSRCCKHIYAQAISKQRNVDNLF